MAPLHLLLLYSIVIIQLLLPFHAGVHMLKESKQLEQGVRVALPLVLFQWAFPLAKQLAVRASVADRPVSTEQSAKVTHVYCKTTTSRNSGRMYYLRPKQRYHIHTHNHKPFPPRVFQSTPPGRGQHENDDDDNDNKIT